MKRVILVLVIVLISVGAGRVTAANVNFDDGQFHTIADAAYQDDYIYLDKNIANNPGTHVDLVAGGSVKYFWAYNNSTITMSGGSVGWHVIAYGNSTVTLSGGSVADHLFAFDDAIITLSGGSVGHVLYSINDGIIYLVGTGFEVDGQSLSYGDKLRDFGTLVENGRKGTKDYYTYYEGIITGTLADGSALDNIFRIYNYGIDAGSADIIIIPEPATLLLLALGGLLIRKR